MCAVGVCGFLFLLGLQVRPHPRKIPKGISAPDGQTLPKQGLAPISEMLLAASSGEGA